MENVVATGVGRRLRGIKAGTPRGAGIDQAGRPPSVALPVLHAASGSGYHMNGPFLRIATRSRCTLQHVVWKGWWVPGYAGGYDGCAPDRWDGQWCRRFRWDGPAIIYQGGNCRWVPHIAKLKNEGAVAEDNKK